MARRFLIVIFALLIAVLASADEWMGGTECFASCPSAAAQLGMPSGGSSAAQAHGTALRCGKQRFCSPAAYACCDAKGKAVGVDAETLVIPHVAVLATPVCLNLVPPTTKLVAHTIETRGPPPARRATTPRSPRAPPAA